GEVRVWSTAKSRLDIRDGMYKEIAGTEAGLVGCRTMATFDDSGVRKVKDSGPGKLHGTVVGEAIVTPMVPHCRAALGAIGNRAGGGSGAGKMAELRVWGTALSRDEIDAVSNLDVQGNEPELLGYWPLNEASGTTTSDRAGGTQATLVGADWEVCTA